MKYWIWGIALLVVAGVGWFLVRGLGRLAEQPLSSESIVRVEPGIAMRTILLSLPAEGQIGWRTEERVVRDTRQREELIEEIVAELFEEPPVDGSFWRQGTALRSVFVTEEDWTAYLDFSRELIVDWPLGDGLEWVALGAIVRSITGNLPELRGVQILVEGETVEEPPGSLPLDLPLMPEWFMSEEERSAS